MKMVFPDESPREGGCDEWCVPLHAVERAAVLHPQGKYFDVDDFMIMIRFDDKEGAIILYKHIDTRHYLNADEQGRVYRYVPGRDRQEGRRGDYLPTTLTDALERLGLWELPWFREELVEDRLGLSWEERWSHPGAPKPAYGARSTSS